jgi:hypothetical protein
MTRSSRRATELFCILAGLVMAPARPAIAGDIIPSYPDPCVQTLTPGTIQVGSIPRIGNGLYVYSVDSVLREAPTRTNLVLIVNGNNYHWDDYVPLAQHLARNGFIVAIGERPNNSSEDPQFVIDALEAVLASLALPEAAVVNIGLIGHSVGGKVVVNGAVLNDADDVGLPIRAVIGLSPHSGDIEHLDGTDARSYLLVYGSQDEDLTGSSGVPREAFAAYDRSGSEGSTACNVQPCISIAPAFERTLIHAYGMDHAGLIGLDPPSVITDPDTEYVDPDNQLCFTKGYTTAFLRWKLLGGSIYKGMIRGAWRPQSIAAITTILPDGLGNPAGSPLQLFFQISPEQRQVVTHFENGMGAVTGKSSGVQTQLVAPGAFSGSPTWVRHDTGVLLVGWPFHNGLQWVRISVPFPARNGSTYTHLSLRIGQLHGPPQGYENPVNEDQQVRLVVLDGDGKVVIRDLSAYGRIPPPDPYTPVPTRAKSIMNTIRVPTHALSGIDRTRVREIYLLFDAQSTGTIIVDSVEWHRD